jgi:choline dehydrogenase
VSAESFDYVVGAGSAGCVVARRLVEAGARVLLLESGGVDSAPDIRRPAAWTSLFGTSVDWAYRTTPPDAVVDVLTGRAEGEAG